MKQSLLFIIILLLLSSSVFAIFNPFSILDISDLENVNIQVNLTNKENVFCLQEGNCTLTHLNVTGTSTIVNETVININTTTIESENVTASLYCDKDSGECYTLAELNTSYWTRTGTVINTKNIGDDLNISGDLTVSGTGNKEIVVDGTTASIFRMRDSGVDKWHFEYFANSFRIVQTGVSARASYADSGSISFNPSADGDVNFFSVSDVGDDANGKTVYVHRKAAEGDEYLRFLVDKNQIGIITTTNHLIVDADDGIYYQQSGGNNIYFGSSWMGSKNPIVRHYGEVGSDEKYIYWQLDNTDDRFHLVPEDSNILGFDIDMNTEIDGNLTAETLITDNEIEFTDKDMSITGGNLTGGYYSFDGDEDYISLDKEVKWIHNGTWYSISFWVHRESDTSSNSILGYSSDNYKNYLRFTSGGDLRIELETTGTNYDISNSILATETWSQYTLQFNGTEIRLYIDGESDKNTSVTLDNFTFDLIGKGHPDGEFNGSIDGVMIFNGTVSTQNITNIYDLGRNINQYSHENLVSRWGFENNNADDDEGRNDGTVNSATWISETYGGFEFYRDGVLAKLKADDFITGSYIYDKTKGNATNLIKDSDSWRTKEGTINYTSHYAYEPKMEGLSMEKRIATLEQSIYELKQEIAKLNQQLATK